MQLMLMLGFAASTIGAPPPPDLALEAYKLPNGLKVALHRDPSVPRVTVCVAYHVGAKNERAGRTGFAHFFEHMMFRGTPHVPNYDTPLQEAGVSTNAFTTEDMTVYHETVPANFLERALYMEAERMGFLPLGLDQKKFDTEREVVKNERLQNYENQPYGLAEEAILANLFPKGHPYSWSVIGSMKDLNAATVQDLRRFFAEFYHPGNAAICLAGDFDKAQAKAWIEKYFGPLAVGPAKRKVEAPATAAKSNRVVQKDRVQFPRVYLNWPTVELDHPDAPALAMAGMILAGGDASRLNRTLVRDLRIAQDVGAEYDGKEIAGLFQITATVAEGKTVAEQEAAIEKELTKLRDAPPEADELARALAKYEKTTYNSLTSSLGRAVMLATRFARKGDPEAYKEEFNRHFRVTPADVQRVVKTYLGPDRLVLEVQPMKPTDQQTPAFLAGPEPTADDAAAQERVAADADMWKTMPGPVASGSFTPPTIVRKTLSNGVEAWIVPWRTLPVVSVRLLLHAGTADDPAGKMGLANLAATMLPQGTKTKNAVEIAQELDALGVTHTLAVGSDSTQFGVDVLSRNLGPALKIVGDLLAAPRHETADFDRERTQMIAEITQGPDDPEWLARRAFRALLHGGDHPYGRPTDGTLESVKALTLDDVKAFHAQKYAAKGATLVVVGDIDPATIAETLNASLASWTGGAAASEERPAATAKAAPGVVYLVDKPDAVQSILRIGRRWIGRKDPNYLAAQLGNRIIGGDFLSRINQNLREKNGYTYGAYTAFRYFRSTGIWEADASVRADATGAALKELVKELDGVRSNAPLSATEIDVNRAAMAKGFPERFETPSQIASVLGDVAEFDLPLDDWQTYLQRLAGAAAATVQEQMNSASDPNERVILVVGDRKTVEPQLKAAGFTQIVRVTADGKPAN